MKKFFKAIWNFIKKILGIKTPVIPTPTPTPTDDGKPKLVEYRFKALYECGDTEHCEAPEYINCASVTYWDADGNKHVDYHCKRHGIITVYSIKTPITVGMSIE